MDSMALCKTMDQILNWPGFAPPPASSSLSESVYDPPRISQPPTIPARENMVNSTIRGLQLLNGSAWVTAGFPRATETRPLSDILCYKHVRYHTDHGKPSLSLLNRIITGCGINRGKVN